MSSLKKRMRPDGRQKVPGDGVEQCRLAGAVRADHRPPLAGGDLHADAGERHQRAEVPATFSSSSACAPDLATVWRRTSATDRSPAEP